MKIQRQLFALMVLFLFAADTTIAKTDGKKWKLVFSEEFNQPNGSQPDSAVWNRHKRRPGNSSHWISDAKEVVFIKKGRLVCRAIPNTIQPNDTARMLTGAINTRGKFTFKYGKVEVRMRTNLKQGNFPAAWIVPQPNGKLPYAEIDIVETYGTRPVAAHTVHSQYTQDHKNNHGEKNTFRIPLNIKKWHVYGVEWNEKQITWTIDGKVTGIYRKSDNPEKLAKGQWTFDVPFYIILNQSVGGGYKNPPDTSETYETQFDWVRVYQ